MLKQLGVDDQLCNEITSNVVLPPSSLTRQVVAQGDMCVRSNNLAPAIKLFSQALSMDEAKKYQKAISIRLLRALARASSELMLVGDYGQAVKFLQQRVMVAGYLEDANEEKKVGIFDLGLAQLAKCTFEDALASFKTFIEVAQEVSDEKAVGQGYGHYGLTLEKLGRVKEALVYYRKALILGTRLDDRLPAEFVKDKH